jgi:arylsulfatase
MTRRDLAKTAMGSVIFNSLHADQRTGPSQGKALGGSTVKPNIVLMVTDNLGYGELGVYGGGVLRGAPTPRVDKLASEGMRLLNFNVEAQCTPSRSALMTGRYPIRSGTHTVPRGGVPEGLTLWEVTLAQLLSAQGYTTGIYGKWHLGSSEARLPTNRGFDEWYGIPRSWNESFWPALNNTNSVWPSFGSKQAWDPSLAAAQPIYEAHKGERSRQVAVLDVERKRAMDKEITTRASAFIRKNASAAKPFFAYVSFSLFHHPTLPHPEFTDKTGNGSWADCLAEMDYRVGQILDTVKEAGVEDNTIVILTSDNGPEAASPWQGASGPWRGSYFTAMEASLRAPFLIRWPGKIQAGRVSNEIVHILDLFTTLAHIGGAEIPKDRPVDGVDQREFFLGKQEKSNREGFIAYVSDRLHAVKWRNWKMHLYWQVNMFDPPLKLPLPKLINLLTDLKEEHDDYLIIHYNWVAHPMTKLLNELEDSLKKYSPIPMGTPDPYHPPHQAR